MRYLTIASLNTFGGVINLVDLAQRYKTIANYFENKKVDIINFQEVFTYYHLYLLNKWLKNSYPFCTFQYSYLGPKGGLVTFTKVQTTKHYASYTRNFSTATKGSKLEFLTQRGILISKLKDLNITILNTHLTAVLNNDWSKDSIYFYELMSEVKQFQKVVRNNKNSKVLIASGDFNIAKDSVLYQKLINIPTLYDPFKKDILPTRHQHFSKLKRKTNCVDYIFIIGNTSLYKGEKKKYIFTRKTQLQNGNVDYISDHMGIYLRIHLGGKASS